MDRQRREGKRNCGIMRGPMLERVVSVAVAAAGVYLALGAAFAPLFVLRGLRRLDPVAAGGSWGFRLIILPGVVALWPLLARRWMRGVGPPDERNAHRDAAARRGA